MPAALEARPVRPAPLHPPRKKWTRAECDAMAALGIAELDHYELVEGELIRKMGKNHPHLRAAMLVCDWLRTVFDKARVVQEPTIDVSPVDIPTSAPEPDAIVLSQSLLTLTARPTPEQIRLIIEISDTTLDYDLTIKAGLYARAGIADYWVLDLKGRRIVAHREPASGVYQSVVAFAADETIAPPGAPQASVRVSDLL